MYTAEVQPLVNDTCINIFAESIKEIQSFYDFTQLFKQDLLTVSKQLTLCVTKTNITSDVILLEFCRALDKLAILNELIANKPATLHEITLYKESVLSVLFQIQINYFLCYIIIIIIIISIVIISVLYKESIVTMHQSFLEANLMLSTASSANQTVSFFPSEMKYTNTLGFFSSYSSLFYILFI